mgnify:CR=1 FL=1
MSNLSDFLKIKAVTWEYKDADFEAQPGGHYIVDTQNNDVTMFLPVFLTPSFFVKTKYAAVLTIVADVAFTRAANVVTVTSVAHGLVNGQRIRLLSSTPDSFTISEAIVTVVNVDSFTFPDTAANATGVLTYTDGIGGFSDPNKFSPEIYNYVWGTLMPTKYNLKSCTITSSENNVVYVFCAFKDKPLEGSVLKYMIKDGKIESVSNDV